MHHAVNRAIEQGWQFHSAIHVTPGPLDMMQEGALSNYPHWAFMTKI
jgi:hypothetical protein